MNILIIGGGPAGIMAAARVAEKGFKVSVLERNGYIGKKMKITGKGRCNITNAGDDILENITRNKTFLYSALKRFSNVDAISFFESIGIATKIERGNRVFPVCDSAVHVVDALGRHLRNKGVKIRKARVQDILTENETVCGVKTTDGKVISADAIILATGGITYPLTGSTGDGFKMAARLGHTVKDLQPSLVPLCIKETFCNELSGLTLKNIGFKIMKGDKLVYDDFGEMLFTHFGISGPVVLSASCHMDNTEGYKAVIDLKPALSGEQLGRRILRDFENFAKRDFTNALDELLPKSLIKIVVAVSGIDPRKKAGALTKEERQGFLDLLKNFTLEVTGFRPIEEAIITSGGIDTLEINPKTMESKLVKGLYFAGEIIDVDAYTGGYNLQIAYSTGWAAGDAISENN